MLKNIFAPRWSSVSIALVLGLAVPAAAQAPDPIRIPPTVVTVTKEPDDPQRLPISVTPVSGQTLRDAGIRTVSEASIYAPNIFFSEFTARKLSNARFRGIGSSPANPGVTTYFDGVPQLNANSSSIELIDVDQVEFVRGAQSPLFGRNTLGGFINVNSRRPSLSGWTSSFSVPFANRGEWDARGSVSGPLTDKLGLSLMLGKGARDGFTVNDVTGNDLDHRSASYGKAQLWWTPGNEWEARIIVSGERARDGDYALNDLASLRSNPFHTSRNFEGFTDRDILSTTLLTRREGMRFAFSTITGFVKWKTQDVTDLDYTASPLVTRDNKERDLQFTQEVRIASPTGMPVRISDRVSLKWQTGVFLFTQDYNQEAVNTIAPFLLSPLVGFPVNQTSPQSELDDSGIGVYGHGTFGFGSDFDLTVAARVDHESKNAELNTFFTPTIFPANQVVAERSFTNVSPQVSGAYHFQPGRMVYASVARGFKAGGFNPASPAGSEAYGEEDAWHVESGVKTLLANGRVSANAALFFIDWNELQLNVPDPNVPGQFYIANVAGATSKGAELELNARAYSGVDLFASGSVTRTRFSAGSQSSGVNVAGNTLPSSPDYTATLGGQFSHPLSANVMLYSRAEIAFNGGFDYDDANTQSQKAFSLANFRAGVRGKHLFGEAWLRNAFDTRYIPIAFPYPNFAPSGFVGEMGAPRRFGITLGVGM